MNQPSLSSVLHTFDALTGTVPDAPRRQQRLLSSGQDTIAGGTSEIQLNILGERQLGLRK